MAEILIAEDDEAMLNFLSIALGRAGHDVTCKTNGTEALAIVKSGKHFDLLLTDVVMPGIDGVELANKASDLLPDLKIMFITGFAAIAMKKASPDQIEDNMITKPFHLNDLVTQIETLLKTKTAQPV